MNRIRKAHVFILAAYLSGLSFSFAQNEKPNIVYLFADQMRAHAMSCMGNTLVKTPNLDTLAAQGLLATHAYSAQPVCTPYRAQLMTGRYGWHTGVTANDIKLPNDEYCIAEVLRDNGYATGYIGKWHLNGNRAGYVEIEDRQGWDFWAALACSHQYFDTRYYYDDPNEPVLIVDGYEPVEQTKEAIGFIQRNAGNPFCLMVSYGPPHNPYQPPAEYDVYQPADVPLRPNVPAGRESTARNVISQYYGLTTSVDDMVGRIMRSLDSLELTNNTIVVFSSDHGDMLQSHGQTLKQRPWEEAANIPFIIRYPDSIPSGQVSDLLINSVDVMPTLLSLAGLEAPDSVDGKDLSLFLKGETAGMPEYILFGNDPYTGNNPGWAWRAIRDREWKYSIHGEGGWFLYNLKEDPYEMNNLIDDPAYRDQYGRLHAHLMGLRELYGDTATLLYSTDPPVHSEPPAEYAGCMDPNRTGYDPLAEISDSSMCGPLAVRKSQHYKAPGVYMTLEQSGVTFSQEKSKFFIPMLLQDIREVFLVDLSGNRVWASAVHTERISWKEGSPLPGGIYILQIRATSGVFATKVMLFS